MEEIIYNNNNKEIEFSGRITSFKFYNQLFQALREHYIDNGKEKIPTFSFIHVDEFESLVLPNLLSIGLIIKHIHGGTNKIPLKIINSYAIKFLENTQFFNYVGSPNIKSELFNINNLSSEILKRIGLEIYEFDETCLGFYDHSGWYGEKSKVRNYNPNHKIQVFDNCSFDYYKNYSDKSIPKGKLTQVLDTIRSKKYNEIKPKVEKYFYEILYYNNRESEDVKIILSILTEIICNSILYSYSLCTAMLQSKEGKTTISISDIGIGFAGSFKYKQDFEKTVTQEFKSSYKDKVTNYLLIFDALHYSKNKERENLYTLLKLIINKGGKMRIHYDNVQVVFSSNRCKNCDIIPLECAKCLLDNLSNDKVISPVRFFNSTYQGVHIEVELDF